MWKSIIVNLVLHLCDSSLSVYSIVSVALDCEIMRCTSDSFNSS